MKRSLAVFLLVAYSTIVYAQATTLSLMPVPAKLVLGNGNFLIRNTFTVSVKGDATDTVLYKAVNRAYQLLNRETGLVFTQKYITTSARSDSASLQVVVKSKAKLSIGIDESYELSVDHDRVKLVAANTIGALHGLQTLLQLEYRDDSFSYFPFITISDTPRFKWRGIMIDVARHFISFEELKKNIDAMEAVKMNVLHLHLTDDEGFRIESKLFPLLHEKGSNGEYYTQAQLKELVHYAGERGIIIVPEYDLPGHSQSWFAGYHELASQPGPYRPGLRMQWQMEHQAIAPMKSGGIADMIANMVAPTFDPTNEKTYEFLGRFIGEMSAIFTSGYIHIGADENNGMAWKLNPAIMTWMNKHNMQSTGELQRYFVQRMYDIIKKNHRQLIGWEEIYHNRLPSDAVVHKWIPGNNEMIKSYGTVDEFAKNHPVLISEGFYLDLFLPAYIHYNNPGLTGIQNNNLWGGEAALWTEQADNGNFDGRLWPRAAAVAERLWSPASINDVDDMYNRLFVISHELDERGLNHIANYQRALRMLAHGESVEALQTFTDVLAPVKGYRKIMSSLFKPAQFAYQTTPLTAVSDIVFTDSETKRKFRNLVKVYLEHPDKNIEEQIRGYLQTWQQNDSILNACLHRDQRLKDVAEHSKNLAAAAAIGLEALDRTGKGTSNDTAWVKQKTASISAYSKPVAETEIAVLPEIRALVTGKLDAEPASYPLF